MTSAKTFCPGHITAFFEICDHDEPLRKGSRGVGFCISKGVNTEVVVKEAREQKAGIWINGRKKDAETTELVVRRLIGARKLDVKVKSRVELPVSQGFGMSGAGALSTAYALNKAMGLKLSKEELIRIAHIAEVESMTGLGDVYPQSLGGLDVRIKPGAPPHGQIRKKISARSIVLCVLGNELETKKVLRNPVMRKKISGVGRELIEKYQKEPSWPKFFQLSREFAARTDLISQEALSAIEAVEKEGGLAAMAMLGNSIFASGDNKKLKRALKNFGAVFSCRVENRGARLIQRA